MRNTALKLFALAFAAWLLGAAPALAQPAGRQVGAMAVDGASASLNGTGIASGVDIPVFDGDMITTGANTSAIIKLDPVGNRGGKIQLDQNSSQRVSFASAIGCFAMELIRGRALISAQNVCFSTDPPPMSGLSRSRISLRTGADGTEVIVIQGSARIDPPASITVPRYHRYLVAPDGTATLEKLRARDAKRADDWTRQYFKASRYKSWVIGTLVAGAILCVVLDCVDGDDRPDRQPPPAPEPAEQPVEETPTDYPPEG